MTPGSRNHTRSGLIFVGVCAVLALAIYLGFRLAPSAQEASNSAGTNDVVANEVAAIAISNEPSPQPGPTESVAIDNSARDLPDSFGNGCGGFWAFLPADRAKQVPFSVQIKDGRFQYVALDYSRANVEYTTPNIEGVLSAKDETTEFEMDCRESDSRATLFITEPESAGREFVLERAKGDIFSIAEKKGWEIGD